VGHWLSDQPDLDGPSNLTGAKISAWVFTPGGQWTFLPGQGTGDGKLTVPDVPAGPFMLRLGRDYFASSSARSFDLDFLSLGRPSRPTARTPTSIALAFTGLAPWQSGDRLAYYAPAAPAADWTLDTRLQPAPAVGSTSVMATIDYGGVTWPTLVDGPGRGDEAWFNQLSTRSAGGATLLELTRALRTKDLKVVDGQAGMLTGALTEVPQTSTVKVELLVPDYVALTASVSPVAGQLSGSYDVVSMPGAERYGDYAGSGVLFTVFLSPSTPRVIVEGHYGNPYPAGWGSVTDLTLFYPVPFLIPGATSAAVGFGEIFSSEPTREVKAGPVRPPVTPVRDPKINGQSAFIETAGATANPLLTWSVPATGPANIYSVQIFRGVVVSGKATLESVALFHTEETSVRIPPDVLQFGESYFAEIRAEVGQGIRVTRPWMRPPRFAFATCLSARFTP
jgi:hypothetical protein